MQAKLSDQVLWNSLNNSSKDGDKNRSRWVNTEHNDAEHDSMFSESVMKMKPVRLNYMDD
jgi:hypothetical protein